MTTSVVTDNFISVLYPEKKLQGQELESLTPLILWLELNGIFDKLIAAMERGWK